MSKTNQPFVSEVRMRQLRKMAIRWRRQGFRVDWIAEKTGMTRGEVLRVTSNAGELA